MDHHWDESTRQERAARREREAHAWSGASRVVRDLDVERRDRMLEQERRRFLNMSPWALGQAWHDQRDLFTRNASVEADGYGVGPSIHPEDGSYAYRREETHLHPALPDHAATLYEREAWPWLNYKEPEDDPYFAHLREHEPARSDANPREGRWRRLAHRVKQVFHGRSASKEVARAATRLELEVDRALSSRRDLDATDIDVAVKGHDVTLEGTVVDRRSKLLAQELAGGVPGVEAVHNRLTLRHDDPTDANLAFAVPFSMGV